MVDTARARANIARMARKAVASGTRLRPHFKTHYSAEIGEWFRKAGVTAITVSSTAMAEFFAGHGWTDILIAFAPKRGEFGRLSALGNECELGLLVDSVETVAALARAGVSAAVWIDVDVGYHRTGIAFDDDATLLRVVERVCEPDAASLHLQGVLTHAGHSYRARSRVEVAMVHDEQRARMLHACNVVTRASPDQVKISIGDTPTCSVADRFDGIDEIRPGNFVFYDVQQLQTGACTVDDLALAVACEVVARYPSRGELVVHGGAVHLSKDHATLRDGTVVFGSVSLWDSGEWRLQPASTYVASVSQEHGVIRLGADLGVDPPRIGDHVLIVPAHACLAANAVRRYVDLDGRRLAADVS